MHGADGDVYFFRVTNHKLILGWNDLPWSSRHDVHSFGIIEDGEQSYTELYLPKDEITPVMSDAIGQLLKSIRDDAIDREETEIFKYAMENHVAIARAYGFKEPRREKMFIEISDDDDE